MSLLPLKGTHIVLANRFPTGSVLRVPGTIKQQEIMVKVTSFFRDQGRSVITMPIERITHKIKETPRQHAENLQLAF